MQVPHSYAAALLAVLSLFAPKVSAQEAGAQDAEALAKQLSNPVASLISVPLQLNMDQHLGADRRGDRYTLNVQPVVPISVSAETNLISRTILPVIRQEDVGGRGSDSGIGDVLQSAFFSPKAPTANGWIWGAGPVLLAPTGGDEFSRDQWAAGPTAVALKQAGPWTYGALTNHLWGFANHGSGDEINATFVQPFLSYTTPSAVTYTVNSESTYDWETRRWNAPVNLQITKVTRVGDQLISIGGGARYYLDAPRGGASGWGFRGIITFLFPK